MSSAADPQNMLAHIQGVACYYTVHTNATDCALVDVRVHVSYEGEPVLTASTYLAALAYIANDIQEDADLPGRLVVMAVPA